MSGEDIKRERRYAILMIAEVSLWEGDKTLPLDRSDEAELDHRKRTANQSHPYNIRPQRKA